MPTDAPEIWVDVHKVGAMLYHGDDQIELSLEFCSELIANFRRIHDEEGYEIPLMRRHDDDGLVYGLVHDLRIDGEYLQAGIEIKDPQLRQAYNAGMLRKFSPTIAFDGLMHPHTGEVLKNVLLEVSFTSLEYQWNLRPPQSTQDVRLAAMARDFFIPPQNQETEMSARKKSLEATPAQLQEPGVASPEAMPEQPSDASASIDQVLQMLGVLVDKMAALEELLGSAEPSDESDESAEPEASEDEQPMSADPAQAEVAAMASRIRQLEDQNVRLELGAEGVDEQHWPMLVELRRSQPALYEATKKTLSQDHPPRRAQDEIGRAGSVSFQASPGAAEILKLAQKKNIQPGTGRLGLWVTKNWGPDVCDEVFEVLRSQR